MKTAWARKEDLAFPASMVTRRTLPRTASVSTIQGRVEKEKALTKEERHKLGPLSLRVIKGSWTDTLATEDVLLGLPGQDVQAETPAAGPPELYVAAAQNQRSAATRGGLR